MRKWLFFSSFMKPGKEWGDGCFVCGRRSFCLWLAELLFMTGGASVGEKNKAFVWGGFEGLVCSEKTVIFAERFVERFFSFCK